MRKLFIDDFQRMVMNILGVWLPPVLIIVLIVV